MFLYMNFTCFDLIELQSKLRESARYMAQKGGEEQ